MEKYKRILGFSEYGVSEFGDVYFYKHARILKHTVNINNGIHSVSIKSDSTGKFKTTSVAKCIALAWIDNPNPSIYKLALHINGDKNDLRLKNIMWGTSCISTIRRDVRNPEHRDRFLSHRVNINTRKMTDDMIKDMIQYRELGYSIKQLETIFPIKKSQIRNILKDFNVSVVI